MKKLSLWLQVISYLLLLPLLELAEVATFHGGRGLFWLSSKIYKLDQSLIPNVRAELEATKRALRERQKK